MDLPFLNNAPGGAPASSGAEFWGGSDPAGGNDDATLNDLLALYQTANDPLPSFEPGPPVPSADAEIEDLIKSFQTPPATPAHEAPPFAPEPVMHAPAVHEAPTFAPAPAEPAFGHVPAMHEAPAFAVAEPVFAPAPAEPVFAPPPIEPVLAGPPIPAAAPPVAAPAAPPTPVVPAAPVAQVVPAAPAAIAPAPPMAPAIPVEVTRPVPAAVPGAIALASSQERQATLSTAVTAINQLTGGIEQIQTQLSSLYEGLSHAAASRAPITEILKLTEQLTATKNQAGENSPLWHQALLLRRVADAYLEMLRTL